MILWQQPALGSSMNKKKWAIFGISFQELAVADVLRQITFSFQQNRPLRISTVNPEFLVYARKEKAFSQSLQTADIRVVDGFGLWLSLYVQGFRGKRITGVELTGHILALAEKLEKKVAIILPVSGLSSKEQVISALSKKYPKLAPDVYYEDEWHQDSVQKNYDVFLFALGMPEQEYAGEKVTTGIRIGVGGALDFLVGTQTRAPKLFQTIGMEWLWRLLLQPKRIKRIWNAVVVFPLLVIFDKKRAGAA